MVSLMGLDAPDTPVLITGGQGMLGRALTHVLGPQGAALDHTKLDISDRLAVARVFGQMKPRLVINCAAATDVDRCETDHEYARAANAEGPAVLAEACAARRIGLVHLSTDYVFDGTNDAPYVESDSPSPLSYYGLTKLWGEEAVLAAAPRLPMALVIRTSWLFGMGAPTTGSFPSKVLRWADRSNRIRVVSDQWGAPTYAPSLAKGILALIDADAQGIYHLAGSGCASRLELTREVLAQAGIDVVVEAANLAEFPTAAPRPRMSCLDCTRAAELGVSLPPWPEGLRRYLVELMGEEPNGAQRSVGRPSEPTPERQPDPS